MGSDASDGIHRLQVSSSVAGWVLRFCLLADGSEGSELRGTGEPLRLGGSEGRGGKAAGSSPQMAWPRCLRGLGGDGGVTHACPVPAQSIFSIWVNKFPNCQASTE